VAKPFLKPFLYIAIYTDIFVRKKQVDAVPSDAHRLSPVAFGNDNENQLMYLSALP